MLPLMKQMAEAKLTGSYLAQQYFEEIDRRAGILRMSIPEKEHLLNQARSVVDSSWKNATWSQRIWKNNEDLRAGLGKGLRASMLEGRNPGDWANKLQRVLQKEMVSRKGRGNAEFLSERLAITEAGRVQIEAQLRSFDAMGYDALEVITEPGACAECLPHDGEIVPLKDARMGENIPMFHPFCRCSTAAHVNRLDVEHMFAELERSDTSLTDAERFQNIYDSVSQNMSQIQRQWIPKDAKMFFEGDENNTIQSIDVTKEYLSQAVPGEGKIEMDSKYNIMTNQNEIKMAHWLHNKFGGDIRLLTESTAEGVKTPDYLWRSKFWELKTIKSEKASNAAIRKGMMQIQPNPGGIVLDYTSDVDIIVVSHGEILKVVRYKKIKRKDPPAK